MDLVVAVKDASAATVQINDYYIDPTVNQIPYNTLLTWGYRGAVLLSCPKSRQLCHRTLRTPLEMIKAPAGEKTQRKYRRNREGGQSTSRPTTRRFSRYIQGYNVTLKP